MNSIEIFDVDGTITHVFGEIDNESFYDSYDLWFCVSRALVKDTELFLKEVSIWKKEMESGCDPMILSYEMMQKAINFLIDQNTEDQIYKIGFGISCDFIHKNIMRKDALLYINNRLEHGIDCVFSSANYKEAVISFRDALIHTGLINSKYKENIHIIGSEIDWKLKRLNHINVAQNKVIGLMKYFNISYSDLKLIAKRSFGDDPFFNDLHLLRLCTNNSYLINTIKNQSYQGNEFNKLDWDYLIQQEENNENTYIS